MREGGDSEAKVNRISEKDTILPKSNTEKRFVFVRMAVWCGFFRAGVIFQDVVFLA